MAKLTLSQAARAAGKSKTQLSRMIENGNLSKEETGAGSFVIDASELLRVYPEADLKNASLQRHGNTQGNKTGGTVTAVVEARLEMMVEERDRLRVELDSVRREQREDKDRHRAEVDRLLGIVEATQRQLTDQREKEQPVMITPPPAAATARRWWPFGK